MIIRNLTGQTLNLTNEAGSAIVQRLPADPAYVELDPQATQLATIGGVPVYSVKRWALRNVPPVVAGTYYIVTREVAEDINDKLGPRSDVFFPGPRNDVNEEPAFRGIYSLAD